MRPFRPILVIALGLALAPASDAGWPGSGRVYGPAAANVYVAASISFAGGVANGVGCSSLSACIADTRSTTATYISASGVLSTAAINAPRIDCANTACGLLNEGPSTNLILYSNNIGGTDWAAGGGIFSPPTVTTNNAIAPDGTTTATKVAFPSTIGLSNATQNTVVYAASPVTVSASTTYTFSTYLKGASGGEKYYNFFTLPGSPYSILAQTLVMLTSQFARYSASGSPGSHTTINFLYGLDGVSGTLTQTGQAASTSYLWGAQLEPLAFATSLIPTTSASASRSADGMSAIGALAAALSAGQSYVDMIDEATGATSRTLYAAGAFNWPSYKWIAQICAYTPTVTGSYLTAHATYGTAC